jgi:putative acetyltransferase
MQRDIVIRPETGADVEAIAEVTRAAFATLAISGHTEQYIIAALRGAKALTLSLVAERDGRVVGHVAFSPVTLPMAARAGTGLDRCRCCRPASAKASARRCYGRGCRA